MSGLYCRLIALLDVETCEGVGEDMVIFDREPKFERRCWCEPLGVPSNKGERLLVPEGFRTCSGMIDDRADESRRLLLMEKSDWVLGEGEEESGILFIEEASDWPEFRIIDRRNGLRDWGLGDSGCWSSAAECGGERMRGCGRRNAVEVRREPYRFRSRKPMGTVELGGARSV